MAGPPSAFEVGFVPLYGGITVVFTKDFMI